MHPNIQNRLFAVCNEPYCAWGWDLGEENRGFISGIDDGYFRYIAETHLQNLGPADEQRAAIALRTNYYLSLETLFSLISASLQSPDFVPGWILKASNSHLREFVKSLQTSSLTFPLKWEVSNTPLTFNHVSHLIHQYANWTKEDNDQTNERFGDLWHRLADDFLDPYCVKEYNSIKHGFRARAGGFQMRIGVEDVPGIPAPPEKMILLGGSKFGSSFYSVERVTDAPVTSGKDPNFVLRNNSMNWSPEATGGKMLLAAISIKNIKSFLAVIDGKPPQEVEFSRLEDPSQFDEPWKNLIGLTSSTMGQIVKEENIYRASKQEMNQRLAGGNTRRNQT